MITTTAAAEEVKLEKKKLEELQESLKAAKAVPFREMDSKLIKGLSAEIAAAYAPVRCSSSSSWASPNSLQIFEIFIIRAASVIPLMSRR